MVLEFIDIQHTQFYQLFLQINPTGPSFYSSHIAHSAQFYVHRLRETRPFEVQVNFGYIEKTPRWVPSLSELRKITILVHRLEMIKY